MKALVLDRPGGPETLHLADLPLPEPGIGEVRVKVHAAGLNPVDYKLAASGYHTWHYPFVLGLDVAGTIEALGPQVTNWHVGDAVYYHGNFCRPGGFAECTIASAHVLAPLPEQTSFVEAAALPCAGLTAYQALHRKLAVRPGQTLLVQGGAGGVGGFAIQLGVLAGMQVITTCSAGHVDWVRHLGATEVIDYQTEDVPTRVRELTKGRGVDAIVDTVSPYTATEGMEMLAFGGGIACVAGLPDLSSWRPFSKALSVHDVALGCAYLLGDQRSQADLAQMGRELGTLVSTRKIDPMVQQVIRLEEIPAALERLSHRHGRGKIVAEISPT
ncbi:zinc-binding alcohol dehydrogenase [Leptolyngbya sp. 'hensonii']|uniref:zinc-binding dehydrogenase n=1 Tax=Leptolyngbya sp. 'hensonii' TaxID=1922337 RepID=UPI0009500D5D|nr:zinc-binding dehydrogenase [Leptolyngbya sp. 'hensonii']OLP18467.1 zinc-binding alcohol dehydrogenase [Leptolyngbya sp. 'hensonii']